MWITDSKPTDEDLCEATEGADCGRLFDLRLLLWLSWACPGCLFGRFSAVLWSMVLTSLFRSASTRSMLPAPFSTGHSSSGTSWPMHLVPRRWQVIHVESAEEAKVHRTFLRLHSQQLCVPFRSLLRFPSTSTLSYSWSAFMFDK